MLKLTVKQGEYLLIGEEVRLAFVGGSAGNVHILVDAPKSVNIARSAALKKAGAEKEPQTRYFKDRDISPEAREKINAILREERRKSR